MAVSRRLTTLRTGVGLLGPVDGVNRIFMTPDKFDNTTISVFHNGRKLFRTAVASPLLGDYFVTEGGGPGSGYDTVNLLSFTPVATSVLQSDYLLA